jgi:hypothetical protein
MRDVIFPEKKLTRFVKAIMSEVKVASGWKQISQGSWQLLMASANKMNWHVCYLI